MRPGHVLVLLALAPAHCTGGTDQLQSLVDYCVSSRWGYTCFRPGSNALIDLSGGRLAHAVVRAARARAPDETRAAADMSACVVPRSRRCAGHRHEACCWLEGACSPARFAGMSGHSPMPRSCRPAWSATSGHHRRQRCRRGECEEGSRVAASRPSTTEVAVSLLDCYDVYTW